MTDHSRARKRIAGLRQAIDRHHRLHHVENAPEIPDAVATVVINRG